MKTITFYSYKGGVGRSLTLANIALRLSEFNKKVCLIDFDLEAPGLPIKFSKFVKEPIESGLVDYIHEYSNNGILPTSILPYCIKFAINRNRNLTLIPAGNIDSNTYWKKLSSIDWYSLVYENRNSVSFFLDLKEKIRREINPDFLLIDSRTGISEMSGITISLLADDVVVISANNDENLQGSKKIIDSLLNPNNSLLGKTPKITFILSRIPFTDLPEDRAKEQLLVTKVQNQINLSLNQEFFIIHSDREL
jgi:MinD-like ATPase involved in chromosome partitioning or flagellar assembly